MCTICDSLRSSDAAWLVDAGARRTFSNEDSTAPEYSVSEIASYLNEGYWGGSGNQRHLDVEAGDTLSVDISSLASGGRKLARKALDAWSDVTGITFVERSGGADITFDDEQSGAYASHARSGDIITSAYINVNKSWAGGGSDTDSYHYQTYLHEIGHALGLGHAGGYNGSADYGKDNHYANDSWQMSLMSYFSQWENSEVDASFGYAITPMIADILAVQELYGTPDTRTGDTIYGRGGNTGTSLDEWLDLGRNVAITIWDGGGTDLIDLSNRGHDQDIDLGTGGISDVLGLRGNLVIAEGTVIENVSLGSGDDSVRGNRADNVMTLGGGADTARGGRGNDTIDGGEGADWVKGGDGRDRIEGGDGADALRGNEGDDDLNGGRSGDFLHGGRDDDTLGGGKGNDELRGGKGDDTLTGGEGDDLLTGGRGGDSFVFETGCGADRIVDFNVARVGEVIDLSGLGEILDWVDLVANHLAFVGGECRIDAGGGDIITLDGIGIGALSEDHFLF